MASHKKRTSGASTKRSNMPAGTSTSDGPHGNSKAQIVALSRGQDPAMNAQGPVRKEQIARGQVSSIKDLPQKACFDAAGIRQWAERSAAGLEMQDFGCFPPHCSTYADDTSLTTVASAVPATFPFSHPDTLSVQPQMYQPYGSEVDLFPTSAASAAAHFARMDISHDLPSGQGMDCPVSYQSEDLALGLAPQGHLNFDDLATAPDLRFDSMELHPSMTLGNPNDFDFSAEWNVQLMTGYTGTNAVGTSNSVDWSSPTALTPSTSSLQSDTLDQQLGTPISATMQDFTWAPAQAGPMATEMEMIPSVGFEESIHARYNNTYVDTSSTLRPKQGFQRTPLPMDIWAQDTAGQAFGLPPYPGLSISRRSSEGENKNARDHPYYKAEPSKEDGLYHCPDPNKDGCTKAEKLKCNYDKHLDSHLKPYRCKSQGCAQAVFSSTACLLRHEREAHSMHGHGNKPHLCHFQDCERAHEDNGFPRRWNLFDHMKRVHDYDPSNKSNSPSPSSSSPPPPQDAPRKRRTPSPTQEGAKKRTRISSPQTTQASAIVSTAVQAQQQPVTQAYARLSLEQMRSELVAKMEARLRKMDHTNPSALEQHKKDLAQLQAIDSNLHKQLAAQLALTNESRL